MSTPPGKVSSGPKKYTTPSASGDCRRRKRAASMPPHSKSSFTEKILWNIPRGNITRKAAKTTSKPPSTDAEADVCYGPDKTTTACPDCSSPCPKKCGSAKCINDCRNVRRWLTKWDEILITIPFWSHNYDLVHRDRKTAE